MRYLVVLNSSLGGLAIDAAVLNAIARLDSSSHVEAIMNPQACSLFDEMPCIARRLIRPSGGLRRLVQEARLAMQQWDVLLVMRRGPWLQTLMHACRADIKRTMRRMEPATPPSEVLARLSILSDIHEGWDDQIDVSIHFDEQRITNIQKKLDLSPEMRVLTIAPGSSHLHTAKRWPAERFAELTQAIKKDYDRVLVLGSRSEAQLCEDVAKRTGSQNLAGEYGLLDICAIMSHGGMHVGNDSGLGHVAAGCGRTCLAIGSITGDEHRYRPWGQHQMLGDAQSIGFDEVLEKISSIPNTEGKSQS